MTKRRRNIMSAKFSRTQEKALLDMEKTVINTEAGNTNAANWPTSDPAIAGAIWVNVGVVTVSAG